MQTLRKMSERQPNLPWLIGSCIFSLFLLIAMVTVAMGEAPQVKAPPLHPSDWILAIGMGIAIPATMLTYWALQFLPQPTPRVQETEETQEPIQHRHIILNAPSARPEVVLRLTRERDDLKHERDGFKRELQALRVEHALLQARQSTPEPAVEPERELTYRAVAALLRAGDVGIKEAIRIVRENGGMVGRKGYDELKDLLPLLSPIAQESPVSSDSQAVNCEPERVNQSVNRKARLPRKKRGWGR